MSTSLSDLRTTVSRRLRDSANGTWSVAEIDDLINQGIDEIADFYPKEIVQTIGTVAASTYSYSASSFSSIYRLDIYTSAGSYRDTFPAGIGGANSGWELHGGILYLPPAYSFTATDTLQAWGYGRYIQLSASTDTTDLSQSGIWALVTYCQAEGFAQLVGDRALFQQWQASPGNSDVTAVVLGQLASAAQGRWRNQQRRLRRMRKTA